MKEYKSMNKTVEARSLDFTFQNGERISNEAAIRDLRLGMGGANINGINLFTT